MPARAAGTATAAVADDIVLGVTPPDLSAAEASGLTHQVELVGAWTTRFFSSERNHFGANIRLPAKFINGVVVAPGAVFDFWGAVGPVTFARGFGMGGIIESGRTNPNGAIGGGICSASTTLFNAAARAGYQILSRDNHSYYISRYPLGLDATVSKYGGRIAQNMRFRNDTSEALIIRAFGSGLGPVRDLLATERPKRDLLVAQRLERPQGRRHPGRDVEPEEGPDGAARVAVERHGRLRDPDGPRCGGRVIHSDRWTSHYVRVDGVLQVGIG